LQTYRNITILQYVYCLIQEYSDDVLQNSSQQLMILVLFLCFLRFRKRHVTKQLLEEHERWKMLLISLKPSFLRRQESHQKWVFWCCFAY